MAQAVVHGGRAELDIEVAGLKPFTYQWFKDDIPRPGETQYFLSIVNAQPSDSGRYIIELIGLCDTVRSDDAVVTVIGCGPGS